MTHAPAAPSPYQSRALASLPGLRHGFFPRGGGVSTGLYASLNCGHGSRDAQDSVSINRAKAASALGAQSDDLLTVHQIHSADVHVAKTPWPRQQAPRADAIVTDVPQLAIGILTADCAPLLLADPVARVAAAAHAGWKGALGGIVARTVEVMIDLGARPERIHAAVGPCISQAAYEVGPEFEAAFLAIDPGHARYFARPEPAARPRFDLPGFVVSRLEAAGVGRIEDLAACTYANEADFFSYRRSTHRSEPDYGRQISAIVLA